ncbi:MAG TPA: prolyl oligopeptidase family serine peptidase, partial [Hyphomonadaceae bacterium]|nr:prolyl oligopeptidase family serine peptidase [Hyphomonadaceae bacterium]
WVKAQNERSLKVLQEDARYQGYYEEALKIATSKERIPYGSIRNGFVYNFWQDDVNERGLWRRATLAQYRQAQPVWETILDVDALATSEGANWVYKGVSCLPPENELCLVELSDGGKDAARQREFNVGPKAFVAGGFDIPEAKTSFEWVDKDTLLVATDWGPEDGQGTLTESGYPFVVKRLKRGQKLSEAVEVFRGSKENVGTFPMVIDDASGKRWFGAVRADTFFTSSFFLFPESMSGAGSGEPVQIPLPPKATVRGVYADTLLVSLEQDWEPGEDQPVFRTGDLVGIRWSEFLATGHLPLVELVVRPTEKQALQGVGISKGAVLVNLSDNVVLKVFSYTKDAKGAWAAKEIPLPEKGAAGVTFTDETEATAFLGFEGFLQPDALYEYDTLGGKLTDIKSLPAWFDAGPYKVDQFEATSKDGTKVPYFVVHRGDMKLDGSNPTLMYGYGGFQVSYPPNYSGTVGKLWLEQGGVYVLANIRGGGEFGPAWHQAGLKTHRQVVYDDFISVAEDLIARKVTSPKKLGAVGGSNGGLLMGVMFTQRPDLFQAIVCQVPLLDMLRYNLLLAGASWMDEYGDPDVPEERAFLEKLSPYHNIDPETDYPEIYFETSTKDDRVHPAHARKMAKRLEELGKPFLYYENIDGGHSAAANQREAARRAALEYTYLARKLIDGK